MKLPQKFILHEVLAGAVVWLNTCITLFNPHSHMRVNCCPCFSYEDTEVRDVKWPECQPSLLELGAI